MAALKHFRFTFLVDGAVIEADNVIMSSRDWAEDPRSKESAWSAITNGGRVHAMRLSLPAGLVVIPRAPESSAALLPKTADPGILAMLRRRGVSLPN